MAAARFALSVQQALAVARSAAGMDKKDVADALGVSTSAVCQVLDGDGNIRVSTIGRYASAMGYQASLRLDPVELERPVLDLRLPANVAGKSLEGNWRLLEGAAAQLFATQFSVREAIDRAVFQTVSTSLTIGAKLLPAPPAVTAPNSLTMAA